MAFDIVFTKTFKKKYISSDIITKETVIQKIREIEHGIFYSGEGRVKGSKNFFKKRVALPQSSKRKGGRLIVILFQLIGKIYVPYALWMANDLKKNQKDQELRNKNEREKIIKKTMEHMKEALKERAQKYPDN